MASEKSRGANRQLMHKKNLGGGVSVPVRRACVCRPYARWAWLGTVFGLRHQKKKS